MRMMDRIAHMFFQGLSIEDIQECLRRDFGLAFDREAIENCIREYGNNTDARATRAEETVRRLFE